MKVIKVVHKRDDVLVSTFAEGEWEKEYAKGVETKPDTGCLFAFSSIRKARADFEGVGNQFWSAEAKVVGKVNFVDITIYRERWHSFWKELKLTKTSGVEYLLCSSITLIKRIV